MQILNTSKNQPGNLPGKDKEEKIPCLVVKSDRRTMAVQVRLDGQVVIRTPRRVSVRQAMEFAGRHRDWIFRKRKEALAAAAKRPAYTKEQIGEFKRRMRPVLEERLAFYADRMGVSYGRVSIRDQKTRWGSCSARGNLNFNWRLYLTPPEILDYVAVHELAHRREMNHSERFWRIVGEILPDYRERRQWLKMNGGLLG